MIAAKAAGQYICFLDSDDVMVPSRIQIQLQANRRFPNAVIGSRVTRVPLDSTPRYIRWVNNINPRELVMQRFKEVSLIAPTWFMHRDMYERLGGQSREVAEDLDFLLRHVGEHIKLFGHDGTVCWDEHCFATTAGGTHEGVTSAEVPSSCVVTTSLPDQVSLFRCDETLVTYRYRYDDIVIYSHRD